MEEDRKDDKMNGSEEVRDEAVPIEIPNGTDSLAQVQKERDEYLDLLRRAKAEFSNYRKRVEREREESAQRIVGDFTRRLFPVLDDLDRAFETVEKEHDAEVFLEGIRLVSEKLRAILREAGVTDVRPEREPFDPMYHEAVMVEEHDELEPGTVSEVLRKGYVMNGKTLRPAQVKVVKAPAGSTKDAETSQQEKEREE